MNKINIKKIKELLQYGTLTCKQISEITGQTLYTAKKIRLKIIESYAKEFPYTSGAHVRTDHFVIWYNNPVINREYKSIYNLDIDKEIANQQSFVLNNIFAFSNIFNYNKLMNNNKLSLSQGGA